MSDNLAREVRRMKRDAGASGSGYGHCSVCGQPFLSEAHKKRVFEEQEARSQAAKAQFIAKIEAMSHARDEAERREREQQAERGRVAEFVRDEAREPREPRDELMAAVKRVRRSCR